jgi:hypothetical protein
MDASTTLCAMTEYVEVFEPEPERPQVGRESRSVDFNHVPPSQYKIHDRLENWGKAQDSPRAQDVSPGFGLHRSDEWSAREYGAATVVSVDREDADKIARGVAGLETRKRLVLDWMYVKRGRDPKGTADRFCLSRRGLAELLAAARQVLIDRGI